MLTIRIVVEKHVLMQRAPKMGDFSQSKLQPQNPFSIHASAHQHTCTFPGAARSAFLEVLEFLRSAASCRTAGNEKPHVSMAEMEKGREGLPVRSLPPFLAKLGKQIYGTARTPKASLNFISSCFLFSLSSILRKLGLGRRNVSKQAS